MAGKNPLSARRRLAGLTLSVAAIAASALASGARAATVGILGGTDPAVPITFQYKAAAGEANDLSVGRDATTGVYTFTELGSIPVTAAVGCTQLTPNSASCDVKGFQVDIALGDQDDHARFAGDPTPPCFNGPPTPGLPGCLSVRGESGSDTLDASSVSGRGLLLDGGDGNDTLLGGAGSDIFRGGAGTDLIRGGAGVDEASYSDHTTAVNATLDGQANDGTPGIDGGISNGADAIAPDVENLRGGAGEDRLRGNEGNNSIAGGAGADQLIGLGSADRFEGGAGPDDFIGGAGADTVSYADHVNGVVATLDGSANDGAPGIDGGGNTGADLIRPDVENLGGSLANDTLVGNDGANFLTGGAGTDRLLGRGGPDSIDANDAIPDTVFCGAGADKAKVDLTDVPAGFEDCETVSQAPVDQHPTVAILSRSLLLPSRGRPVVSVRLRCPQALASGCRGSLAIRSFAGSPRSARVHRRSAVIGSVRYRKIAAGSSRRVAVAIKPRAANAARAQGNIEVRVEAQERDPSGRLKLSLKTMKLNGPTKG